MTRSYETVVQCIQQLADEQQSIYRDPVQYGLSPVQRHRLSEIKGELQSLWLERKRARVTFRDVLENFGEDRKFSKIVM